MVNLVNYWTLLNLEPDGDTSLLTSKKSKLAKIDGLSVSYKLINVQNPDEAPCPSSPLGRGG